MASTNFKLFDENKTNMMSDTEYNINTQRLNGVQAGIASSQLQNKTLYQTSLVAYSLAQIMMQNGYDANDSAAVSAFVGNMSNSLLQKVLDKATSAEAQAGTITNKWISPATMKAAALLLSGGTMSGPINMGNNKITNLADPTDSLDSANKKYVDKAVGSWTSIYEGSPTGAVPIELTLTKLLSVEQIKVVITPTAKRAICVLGDNTKIHALYTDTQPNAILSPTSLIYNIACWYVSEKETWGIIVGLTYTNPAGLRGANVFTYSSNSVKLNANTVNATIQVFIKE